ncbi:MAG TPA: N-acetylmuramoyl-L-alanine amidase [Vicinamibacterales bacterium]|nr:N-acetylmuramoyl-L-alanine amidase [Vicinamibacterales bacterium]
MGITMVKRTRVCFAVVLCVLTVLCGLFRIAEAEPLARPGADLGRHSAEGAAAGATVAPVRSMYRDAMAREQKVRVALNAPDAAPVVLNDVRAVVAAYEAIVRHYPASGYSDNALWQAGRLSLDAFARFGQASDRNAGVRNLRRLAAGYPTSKLAKQVPEQLTRAAGDGDPALPPSPGESADHRIADASGQAGPRSTLATIKDIRRVVLPDAVRITIELDSEVAFHEERIPDPARVFVDLPGTRASPGLIDQTLRFEGDADIVRQVRIGRHPNNTTRVVLEAAGVTSYSVYPLYSPYRLVIDCVRVPAAVAAAAMTDKVLGRVAPAAASAARQSNEAAAAARPLAPLPARTMTNPWLRKLPGLRPRSTALLAAIADASAPAPVAPTTIENLAVATPERNATGGLSMARQLGLGVSRIVIDPGHGGHDPGARGKGVTEAELVLDVALRLEKLLQQVPGVDVILTRRSDEFVQLPERTAIANREGADLFLSIHANASASGQAHGIETYFLNFANNQSAAAVAARENAASTQAMGGLPDFVKAIAMNNKLDESRDFALHVQRAMVDRQRSANKTLKDLGVKQAPFVVLIGANMPSVLAEMGFVTNLQEAKLLKANAYRQKIAESLFAAIRKYQTSLKNVSTVAHQ